MAEAPGGQSASPGSVVDSSIALTAAGNVRSDAKGLDKCGAPSHPQMNAFYSGTDWFWWGIYIGGSNMACPNTNVTASYINQEVGPWRMLFIWVGPQPPCSGGPSTFSSNTTTAFNQGQTTAQNAYLHAKNDLNLNTDDLPIVFDLEAYDSSNASCLAATKAFLRGWTTSLHQGPDQRSGVYGSSCGSALDDYYGISPNPDFIWGANFGTTSHTSSLSCVASNHWGDRRHKQYEGDVQRTENGITLDVDVDCSAGPLYGIQDTPVYAACS